MLDRRSLIAGAGASALILPARLRAQAAQFAAPEPIRPILARRDRMYRVTVCLRPEHLRVDPAANDADTLNGVVEMGLPLGATVVHEIRVGDGTAVKISEPRIERAALLAPGTPVRLAPVAPRLASVFAAA